MSNRVALIGAGAMGGAIGTRLVETGNRLTVFDPGPEKVQALVDRGAFAAASAAEAAAASDYVILSLNAPAIVRRAVFGEAGVAAGARRGTLIIDMSSIDPEVSIRKTRFARGRVARSTEKPLMPMRTSLRPSIHGLGNTATFDVKGCRALRGGA